MASISADREWLEKSIESEFVRFYPYDSLINKDCIGHGAFGIVFKASIQNDQVLGGRRVLQVLCKGGL